MYTPVSGVITVKISVLVELDVIVARPHSFHWLEGIGNVLLSRDLKPIIRIPRALSLRFKYYALYSSHTLEGHQPQLLTITTH